MENYCHFLFYIYVPILILPKNYTLVFDSRLLNKKFFKEFLNIIKKERDYLLIDKPTLFEKGLNIDPIKTFFLFDIVWAKIAPNAPWVIGSIK